MTGLGGVSGKAGLYICLLAACGGRTDDGIRPSEAGAGSGGSGGVTAVEAAGGTAGTLTCAARGGSCQSPDLPCGEGSEWHGSAPCGDVDNNSCCVPRASADEPCRGRFTGLVVLRDDYWDTFGQELLVEPETCLDARFDFDAKRLLFDAPEDRARLWAAGFPLPDGDRVLIRVTLDGRANDWGGDTYSGELEVSCIQKTESAATTLEASCFAQP